MKYKHHPSSNGTVIFDDASIVRNKSSANENPRLSIPLLLHPYLSNEKNRLKFSLDYIYRLIEQNERRCEQQEHNAIIEQEWQILGRVMDRLFVSIFLIGTMLVFGFIFYQAPHLRLK
jgi:hypothetical protein